MTVWFLFWIAVGGFFFVWTLFLQQGLGWTPMHAGLTAATFALGAGIGAGNGPSKLVPKFGRNVLVAGGIINATGFVAFSVLVARYGHGLAPWQIIPVHVVSARLSPFVRHHINVLGRYSFQLPDLPGGMRPLRYTDTAED